VRRRPIRKVPIVLTAGVLQSLLPAWRAAALAAAHVGFAAVFAAGVAYDRLGPSAVWFVLPITLLAGAFRAVDIESYALFLPGGLGGRAREAFGPTGGRLALAAGLTERIAAAALAASVAGHYLSTLTASPSAIAPFRPQLTPDSLSTFLAIVLLGVTWLRERHAARPSTWLGRSAWMQASLGTFLLLAIWGGISLIATPGRALTTLSNLPTLPFWPPLNAAVQSNDWLAIARAVVDAIAGSLAGLALTAFALGSGDALAHVAPALPQPRIPALRRTALTVTAFGVIVTAGTTFLCVLLLPPDYWRIWRAAPLSGLAQELAGATWFGAIAALLVAFAAAFVMSETLRSALVDARGLLHHAAARLLPIDVDSPAHPKLLRGFVDVIAAGIALVIVAASGQPSWLAMVYAVGVIATLLLKTATLVRLRAIRPTQLAFRVPFNVRLRGRERPAGLLALAALLALLAIALLLAGGPAAVITAAAFASGVALLTARERQARREEALTPDDQDTVALLSRTEIALEQVEAAPGNALVAVRNPHVLPHLLSALREARGPELVVMTSRLTGVDVQEEDVQAEAPTDAERRLFSRVLTLAEQHGRVVRLVIVPAHDVFDAIVTAAVRLRSSIVYVGESSTLSADEQARLLGEAWERTDKPPAMEVRLIVQHQSGGRSTYHLGVHAPALTTRDLDLIHQLWLDAAKAVGPHVHHHDVVRAALTKMAEELRGPARDTTLEAIRQTARPADELAAAVRARDFSQLRDRVRNRPPADVAALLGDLGVEDQVVVFRVLPRKTAAATFEYLSLDAQETLLKAMAQEDVAGLLNNMAPDDRTMFLEELPAPVTRQLLALLTPEERTVAVALLGYPENSVGRLMTPHYVAVREEWTVQAVLDYIRTHGQDSETLNVIYVVDENGALIDDIRIREFLLTSPVNRVADLMDRRFVALKATDNQETAIAAFREYDRSALPVTDTAGMLIGIVTIDDVLDVAEARATQEIHRIGGSEALDEPYMRIAFSGMIRKRAGWLTALFLGEMLTATAMGAFEAEIERAVVLALFVPLIISSGGNSGSQASTLVIRALALGEVGLSDWWRVMRREFAAGLSLGAILGSIGFFRISVWSAFSNVYGEHWLLVAITVGLALIGIVLWGTLIGSLLPFVLRRLGFDPATSSAPFVATLVDVTGLVIYFSVAMVVLRGTLL